MQFLVFQRADSALLVVPALFQPPLATRAEGALAPLGTCDLELEQLNPSVADSLARHGYAVVEGQEWSSLQVAIQLASHPWSAPEMDKTHVNPAVP